MDCIFSVNRASCRRISAKTRKTETVVIFGKDGAFRGAGFYQGNDKNYRSRTKTALSDLNDTSIMNKEKNCEKTFRKITGFQRGSGSFTQYQREETLEYNLSAWSGSRGAAGIADTVFG